MINIRNRKVMVVAAHPDDEMMGCGGTVRKLLKCNAVSVVILGEGMMSRSDAQRSRLNTLRKDALAANRKLGVKNIHFGDFPDNRFDSIPLLDIVKVIERWVEEEKPDLILTHHEGDLNIDHRRVCQAVMAIVRPQPGQKRIGVLSFETPSATEWNVQSAENVFKPNLYVDVTDVMSHKLQALKHYKTELRKYPHARSLEGIKIMALNRGCQMGAEYAEAFEVVRMFGI